MTLSVPVFFERGFSSQFSRTAARPREGVLSIGLKKSYHHREEIFFEGDLKKTVYQIESGAVCLYKTMIDGRRQIFDFASEGDLIGLGGGDEYSHSAQAIGAADLKCIPFSTLHQIASRDRALHSSFIRSSPLNSTQLATCC